GLTIVSGLAKGIDTAAHKAVVSRKNRTIAVLGSGINERNIYPQENLKLAEEIVDAGGAVISEFPFGDVGLPYHFPQRNRIISGLSLGTVVVESKMKSGAMITASWAADQGREVFAVPGQINFLTSDGPNYLIKQGAKLVTNANDILEELSIKPLFKQTCVKIKADSLEEEKILEILKNGPLHVDKIIEKTKLNANIISSTITIMEIAGKIKNLGKNIYVALH
ncbi:MAG: DNA-processing protein DprA, partial [Syntrophales bacterium]|nr:DNA-processing protein DprA [Syntrophales bacterium]